MTDPTLTNIPELTVSELSGAIKRTIEGAFERVRVRAELGRVVTARSGHMYLDLKDERACIAGVAWKGMTAGFTFKPEEGLEVIAEGRLSTFPGQSKYQLIIERLEPAGVGALMALLEERKKKLAAEGLFDEARKRPLPFLPEVIGVVTSPTGAVIRDILHRLGDRFPRHVLVWPVLVQGEKSAGQVASAISGFNAIPEGDPLRPDLLIVARGGGSIEDLWGFNEEVVARAAAGSGIPLISAVGHETDWTLIDFVSDYRAPTPTGAAEKAVPVRAELTAAVSNFAARMGSARTRQFDRAETLFRSAARALKTPDALLSPVQQRLDACGERLKPALRANTSDHARRLHLQAGRLQPSALRGVIRSHEGQVRSLGGRARTSLQRNAAHHGRELARLSQRLSAQKPDIARPQERLETQLYRLRQAAESQLDRKGARLDSLYRLLEGVNPKGVLGRGYALVHREGGGLARSAGELARGDRVALEFADGRIGAAIGGAAPAAPAPETLQPKSKTKPRPKPVKKPSADSKQGDLF